MIRINNINITYDRPLLINGSLELYPGDLTVIKGESGIGKTSLLNIVGLLSSTKNLEYHFYDQVITDNDQLKANFRKQQIGYVLQENYLFEHLSIFENLKLYQSMIHEKISEEKAKDLLDMVHLNKDIHSQITSLSGGERQRLAIACALSKKPKLIILDEPTSALDNKNAQMIMDILKDLAKQGFIILMASHDQNVINQCDVIYEIEHQHLIKKKSTNKKSDEPLNKRKVKLGPSFYINYCCNYFKQHLSFQMIVVSILSIVFSLMIGFPLIYKEINHYVSEPSYSYLNKEFYVTNTKDYEAYDPSLSEIEDWKIKRIEKMPECLSLYPFFENVGHELILNDEKIDIDFTVQPYFPEKEIQKSTQYLVSSQQNQIYMSASSAKKLHLKNNDEDSQLSFTYPSSDGKNQTIDMKISGVIDEKKINNYSNHSEIIYVPYQKMAVPQTINALVGYVTEEQYAKSISGFIHYIDTQLFVENRLTHFTISNYEIQTIIETFAPMMLTSSVFIGIFMLCLIYIKYIQNRKLEICLLKINGLNKIEIIGIIITELLIQTLMISFSSTFFISLFYYLVTSYYHISLSFHFIHTLLICLGSTLVFMSIPSLIAIILFQKYDPAILLRTDY